MLQLLDKVNAKYGLAPAFPLFHQPMPIRRRRNMKVLEMVQRMKKKSTKTTTTARILTKARMATKLIKTRGAVLPMF
jgi:hypothetical protein